MEEGMDITKYCETINGDICYSMSGTGMEPGIPHIGCRNRDKFTKQLDWK